MTAQAKTIWLVIGLELLFTAFLLKVWARSWLAIGIIVAVMILIVVGWLKSRTRKA